MNQTSIQGIGPILLWRLKKIVHKCDVRDRVAVLIMLSTGMRIGGLRELCYGEIKKIEVFGIYLIWVYDRSGKDIPPFVLQSALLP
jgi:hypothetical protein